MASKGLPLAAWFKFTETQVRRARAPAEARSKQRRTGRGSHRRGPAAARAAEAAQVGRDKLYRLVQYVARYVGARSTGDTQQKYQKLSSALSTSRKRTDPAHAERERLGLPGADAVSARARPKLGQRPRPRRLAAERAVFRLGKPLENLNNIVKALDTADVVLRSATIGRNLFLGLWLLQDMFQWVRQTRDGRAGAGVAGRTRLGGRPAPDSLPGTCSVALGPGAGPQLNTVGFIKVEDIKRLNTNASRAWFIGLLFSVTLDLYKLQVNQAKQAKVRASLSASSSASDQEGPRRDFKTLQTEQRGLLLDLVRDVFDLSIPGSSLEYVKIDTGTVGLLGAVTSCIGIYQNWGK